MSSSLSRGAADSVITSVGWADNNRSPESADRDMSGVQPDRKAHGSGSKVCLPSGRDGDGTRAVLQWSMRHRLLARELPPWVNATLVVGAVAATFWLERRRPL